MPTERERQPAALGDDARDGLDRRVARPLRLGERRARPAISARRAASTSSSSRAASSSRLRHAEPPGARAVELLGPVEQRRVAALAHVGDDRRDPRQRLVEPGAPHATSRSTGRTRIDDAPAAFSGGEQVPDVVGVDGRVHRDLPRRRRASSTDGAPMPGSSDADLVERRRRARSSSVAPAAGGDDAGEHQLEPLDELGALLERRLAADEHGLRLEQRRRAAAARSRSRSSRSRRGRRSRRRARAAAPPRPSRRRGRARRRSRARFRQARVETGYAVATRSPSRSRSSVCGASAGTAACSVQRAKPSSASVTTSASASATRFAPVIPRSTTPSCTYSGMSLGAHEQEVDRRVRAGDERASGRSPRS